MAVILTIINSSRKVKVAKYKEFCRTRSLLIKSVPWIEISPSAHIAHAHSAEVIEGNNSTEMLNFTESGIEANNKCLRQYCINYARKTSQFDNISDCISRIWDKSNPMLLKGHDPIACSNCKAKGHKARSCEENKDARLTCSNEYETLLSFLSYNSISRLILF